MSGDVHCSHFCCDDSPCSIFKSTFPFMNSMSLRPACCPLSNECLPELAVVHFCSLQLSWLN